MIDLPTRPRNICSYVFTGCELHKLYITAVCIILLGAPRLGSPSAGQSATETRLTRETRGTRETICCRSGKLLSLVLLHLQSPCSTVSDLFANACSVQCSSWCRVLLSAVRKGSFRYLCNKCSVSNVEEWCAAATPPSWIKQPPAYPCI